MSVNAKYGAAVTIFLTSAWLSPLVVLVAAKANITNIVVKFATPCESPNREEGLCIELSKCPALQIAAQSGEVGLKFIEESKCGPPNENVQTPRVCCGRYSGYLQGLGDGSGSLTLTTPISPIVMNTSPFPTKCGVESVAVVNRIVGGTDAQLGEFPWIVRLRHLNEYGYKTYGCSGFLIHEKYVLTAAHCVTSSRLEEVLGPVYEVQLGEHDTSKEIDCNEDGSVCAEVPQIIGIRRVIVHSSYNRTSRNNHNDIAIIHLKRKASFNDFVQPICMSESVEEYNGELWVSGWGATEHQESSTIKRMVSLHSVNFSVCAEKYRDIHVDLKPTQICAGGDPGKDSCSGDSGGPLMRVKPNGIWYAEGVVSFGVGCGRRGWPGVYSYIPMYYRWIKSTIIKREANDAKVKTKSPATGTKKKRNTA